MVLLVYACLRTIKGEMLQIWVRKNDNSFFSNASFSNIFSTVYIIRVVGGAKIAFDLHHSYVAASFLMLIVSPLHLQLVVRIHRLFYRTSSSSALEAIFGYLIYFLQVKLCAFVDCDCRYCAACGCCMCCCCIVLLLFCY
jgi:hypothetical protein